MCHPKRCYLGESSARCDALVDTQAVGAAQLALGDLPGRASRRLDTLLALLLDEVAASSLLLRVDKLAALNRLGVGVEAEHDVEVAQRVLLVGNVTSLLLGRTQLRLDLVGVDDAGDVRVGDQRTGEVVVLLELARLLKSAVKKVKAGEGTLRSDDEAAQVATRRKLKKVQPINVGEVDTGDVAESLGDTVILVVHDKGPKTLDVAAVAHLALARTKLARGLDTLQIRTSTVALKDLDRLAGLLDAFNRVAQDKGDFGNLFDAVTTGQDQRGNTGRRHGRREREAALAHANLAVPLAPNLGRGEHAATTALVAERGLAGTVRTPAVHARNTGHSTPSTPRLGGSLHAGDAADSIRLATVLGDVGVNELDNIGAQGSLENARQRNIADSITSLLGSPNLNNCTGSHFFEAKRV